MRTYFTDLLTGHNGDGHSVPHSRKKKHSTAKRSRFQFAFKSHVEPLEDRALLSINPTGSALVDDSTLHNIQQQVNSIVTSTEVMLVDAETLDRNTTFLN